MRVGIIGDSQSEGLAPSLIPRLEARGDRVVGTMLVRGMSLASLFVDPDLVRRARAIADASEGLIVILGGNNRRIERATYAPLLADFLRRVAVRPRVIWWVGPAYSSNATWGPRHARTRALQSAILGSAARVRWIDAWPMTERGVELGADGLHFTRAGYRAWSARLIDALVTGPSAGALLGAGMLGAALGVWLALARR